MQEKQGKRILSVTIRRMYDESPDTSDLGEYSDREKSEFAIDRAHSLDCASQSYDAQAIGAHDTLERAAQTVADFQKAEEYSEEDSSEWQALEEAYNALTELAETVRDCDCGESGDRGRHEYRYFNPASVESFNPGAQWLAKYPADQRKVEWRAAMLKNARQDYDRMESLQRGNWCYIGTRVDAEIGIGNFPKYPAKYNCTTQKITSGGLWGVESDSGREYFEQVEAEELSSLKEQLAALGFSRRAISQAFKNIERKED